MAAQHIDVSHLWFSRRSSIRSIRSELLPSLAAAMLALSQQCKADAVPTGREWFYSLLSSYCRLPP